MNRDFDAAAVPLLPRVSEVFAVVVAASRVVLSLGGVAVAVTGPEGLFLGLKSLSSRLARGLVGGRDPGRDDEDGLEW